MSFTPGPNNLMLANAGVRVGFPIIMLCVGFGIAALIATKPALYAGMTIASILYLL